MPSTTITLGCPCCHKANACCFQVFAMTYDCNQEDFSEAVYVQKICMDCAAPHVLFTLVETGDSYCIYHGVLSDSGSHSSCDPTTLDASTCTDEIYRNEDYFQGVFQGSTPDLVDCPCKNRSSSSSGGSGGGDSSGASSDSSATE